MKRAVLAAAGLAACVLAAAAFPGTPRPLSIPALGESRAGLVLAQISGDPDEPRRHFRVQDPARLTPAQAEVAYAQLKADLAAAYALSGHSAAREYLTWTRHNRVPYKSVTHGRRYLNNYANDSAADYGNLAEGERMPVGSIIAKDSFSVTADGAVNPGPLFVMEKMPAGFNYVSGDWRYTMIMPDGSLFGITKGEGARRVEFCIGCHLAAEARDHLYYVPEPVRIPAPNAER